MNKQGPSALLSHGHTTFVPSGDGRRELPSLEMQPTGSLTLTASLLYYENINAWFGFVKYKV